MASKQSTADFILEQISAAGIVRAKKMFGEYGIYCDDKVVALICDDQLFVKPSIAGERFIGACVFEPPYPSAKPYLLISGEKWDDHEWLAELIKITASQMPPPQKNTKTKKK